MLRSSLTRPQQTRARIGFPGHDDGSQQSARCPIEYPNRVQPVSSEKKNIALECGIANGETRTRTGDTTIFSRRADLFNSDGIPANALASAERWRRTDRRKLRSFVAHLGTQTPFGAQSGRSIAVRDMACTSSEAPPTGRVTSVNHAVEGTGSRVVVPAVAG